MADSGDRVVATNRRARREFDLLDTWEAGLVLRGSEVKSLRESKVQIAESFVRSEGRELWLVGLHVTPYSATGSPASGHDPDRPKKLLLHRTEISRIVGRMAREGLTVVPLQLPAPTYLDPEYSQELGIVSAQSSHHLEFLGPGSVSYTHLRSPRD